MLICLIEGRKTALPLSFLGGGERPLRPPLDPPLCTCTCLCVDAMFACRLCLIHITCFDWLKKSWGYFHMFWIWNSNITSFFRFVDKRAIYRWYNLIRTCAGECDRLFHWQHTLRATFSANVNINYRLPIKVYYRICTLRHIRIEINHGSQNVFWVLTWVGGY